MCYDNGMYITIFDDISCFIGITICYDIWNYCHYHTILTILYSNNITYNQLSNSNNNYNNNHHHNDNDNNNNKQ